MAQSTNPQRPLIPLVDFSKFRTGSQAEKQSTAAAIDHAFQNSGFVYLSNHGVAKKRIDECFDWSKKWFNLPHEKKMLAPHPEGGAHHRGYSGIGQEKISQFVFDRDEIDTLRNVSPDLKESFESGNINDNFQPNIFPPPDVIPGFQPFMEGFFDDCNELVHQVLECLSLALHLDEDKNLSRAHKQSLFQLRLLHYPQVPTNVLKDGSKTRISAHSDFGTLTLLWQDNVGGLEVEDPKEKGKFLHVEPKEGTVLVNIADCLERWSNGRWKSTVHRVGAPPTVGVTNGEMNGHAKESGVEEVTADRYSVVFFAGADAEAVVDALPGCFDENNPKKYEPITALDYIKMRMEALY